jgi:predicted GNAT family N-acyltransferase
MQRTFDIRLMNWDEARAQAQPVRIAVFVVEQQVPADLEWDEWDALSTHAIAITTATADTDNAVIGTARLLPADVQGAVRIGRMAVLKHWRGQGVGAALLSALVDEARCRGASEAVLHAQTYAAGFYRRYGFSARGAAFLEAGIPHVEMWRPLDTALRAGRDAPG